MVSLKHAFLVSFFVCAIASGQGGRVIGGVWSGNVTPTTATVVARLDTIGARVRLQVSENPALTSPIFSSVVTTAASTGATAKLNVQGLRPDTDYYYGLEIGGTLRAEVETRGQFRTFPQGRASFRVAFASCGDFRKPNQRVYDAIRAERPLLFLNIGDLHYSDTNTTVTEEYRANYDQVVGHEQQGALYRSVPIAYIWDDHDYCGNNSDTTALGRDSVRVAYRERVPHYPIGPTGGTIGQAFTIGRVRFIMTDLRSAAVAATTREGASKTRLGTAQKTWFKEQLLQARDNGFPLVVWVCPDSWIAPAQLGSDGWGSYTTERTEIANFIRDNKISNLVLLSGDMHALAFDDGTNSDYATGGGAPLTVLHGAALTSEASAKGGPYSGGMFPGNQQYGILEVYDNGGASVACRFLGMKVGEGRKLTHFFSGSIAGSSPHAIENVSTLARVTSPTDSVVSGFVISGGTPRTVLIRAAGPTLSAFNVSDALAQPVLSVYEGERQIAGNAGWAGPDGVNAVQLGDTFDRAGAFRFASATSADSALVLTLAPGPYTMHVKSGSGGTGSVLMEVYELP